MYNWQEMFNIICKRYTGEVLKEKYGACMEKFMRKLKNENEELYSELMDDLYVLVFGEHFCEELAKEAVENMKNADGTTGAHWSLKEAVEAAKNEGIKFNDLVKNEISSNNFNEYDWFYVLNMIYSDFYKVFNGNTNMYVKAAFEWLNDIDVKPGKAYRYYMQVVK